jgi:hypothetical protein
LSVNRQWEGEDGNDTDDDTKRCHVSLLVCGRSSRDLRVDGRN